MAEFSAVGKSQPRLDGFAKLSGTSEFADDVHLPGMLQGRVVRSTVPHGRVVHLDTRAAEKVPGVKAILTRADAPKFSIGMFQPVLDDTVRYIGQEIAAIAALDEDAAFEAAAKIRVEYEPLPTVTDLAKALEPGAPQLHAKAPGNLAWNHDEAYGDVERAFAESARVVEGSYASNASHNCYAEYHVAVADYTRADKLTVWSPTQSAVLFQKGLAKAFGLTESQVRMMTLNTGGAFTGRGTLRPHHYLAALLSRKSRRPVKLRAYADEEFLMGRAGGRVEYRLKSGLTADGRLKVVDADLLVDTGAYIENQMLLPTICGKFFQWLFTVEAVHFRGRLAYTNNMPYWFHHGGGMAQMNFAWGLHLDAVARAAGMDLAEFFLQNAVARNHVTVGGTRFASCGLKECIRKAAAKSGWKRKRNRNQNRRAPATANGRPPRYLKGIGMGLSAMASGAKGLYKHDTSAALIKVHEDGTLTLITGIPDMGQGSHTAMAIIAAEVLGISPTAVNIVAGDTDVTPFDLGAFSQRGTFNTGNAVKAAAEDARNQLARTAALKFGVRQSAIVFREGKVFPRKQPELAMAFPQLVYDTLHSREGRFVMGRGFYNSPAESGSMAYSFGAQVAEVTVDTETGFVSVDRVVAVHDLGRAINPMAVEGQIDGQVFSGLSQVLYEEVLLEDGQPLNGSRLDYRLPRSFEAPLVEHVIVETVDPYGPFGAKEVGEGPIVATTAAVACAVADALGSQVREMPVSPWRILRAVGNREPDWNDGRGTDQEPGAG